MTAVILIPTEKTQKLLTYIIVNGKTGNNEWKE
jgi:hypothetical protein